MDQGEFQAQCQTIVDTAVAPIPVGWHEVYIGANLSQSGPITLLFFYTAANDPTLFLRGQSIPWDYGTDKKVFDQTIATLQAQFTTLREWIEGRQDGAVYEFALHGVYHGETTGQLGNIDWLHDTKFTVDEQVEYFRYKYLNYVPQDHHQLHRMKKMAKYEEKKQR